MLVGCFLAWTMSVGLHAYFPGSEACMTLVHRHRPKVYKHLKMERLLDYGRAVAAAEKADGVLVQSATHNAMFLLRMDRPDAPAVLTCFFPTGASEWRKMRTFRKLRAWWEDHGINGTFEGADPRERHMWQQSFVYQKNLGEEEPTHP